jgi:hypothetical protein
MVRTHFQSLRENNGNFARNVNLINFNYESKKLPLLTHGMKNKASRVHDLMDCVSLK